MSHHFDTKSAKEDPSLNVCDFYLFQGAPGSTVMAMTVNPDVGLSVPDILHVEGIYAFRFDVDADAREEVAFKFRFGEPTHVSGSGSSNEQMHVQKFQVRRATGPTIPGDGGEILIEGETGKILSQSGVRVYAGTTPDLFAGNAVGLRAFLTPFYKEQRFNGDAFLNRQNYFANRNITALVLEVPTEMIGQGRVGAWATTSLYGHAPEMQIQRWGLPLMTHIFLSAGDDLKDKFNASVPADDLALFAKPIAEFTKKMATYVQSVVNPSEYGKQVVARLCPAVLPYELGTPAAFDQAGFNGRAIGDDVMDVMLTLASNKPLADGVAPDRSRTRSEFPYFGEPYRKAEQSGATPVPRPAKN
jgi:Domain of unknown function (DUF4331)